MTVMRLNINGKEVTGYKEQTLLQVARENNIDIPALCYDERIAIYGSCGLCVVEVEGIPKLLRACATEIADGMIVHTHTEKVIGARKIALELLLSDHTGDCRPPCVLECPGQTDCQGYVGLTANGEYREALALLKEQLPFPASIGRVCPHPCEDACRRQLAEEPIAIAWIKRFIADIDMALDESEYYMPEIQPPTGKKAAIVGGGPGGLSAAYYLAQYGHDVTVYEAMPEMGGMLKYGIPQYRLPKDILNKEIALIEKMGVKMLPNMKVGKDITLDFLKENHDAVYISIGAWESTKLNCPGEDMDGVMGGIHFLSNIIENKPVKIGEKVAVVGGGNTAMDTCRTAVRLGAKKVYNIYRRSRDEMPAEEIEIVEAEEEGVVFKFLVNPIEIVGEGGKVKAVRLQKMKLGEPDESGRRKPVPIEGEEEIIEVDSVIASIGQAVKTDGFEVLQLTRWNTIYADENSFLTNIPGVFAGGDATNNKARIAIQAIGDAKKASDVINSYLQGKTIPHKAPFLVKQDDLTEDDFADRKKEYRPHINHLSPEYRRTNFEEVAYVLSVGDAQKEAMRCLECGCHDYFECKLLDYANEYDVKPERFGEGEVHKRQFEDTHPFIARNADKCILCGLCVRVCEEVMGVTALGIVDRGFDAIVKPAFELPLKDSGCISCGQCISICPTGALLEKLPVKKPVPLKTRETHTICSHCSVGCNINLNSRGNMLVRALPDFNSKVDEGLLCVKGRFGFDIVQKDSRLKNPLIRKEGKLEEVSWDEAFLYTAKRAQSLGMLYGNDSVAVSVSDRYTNEEIYIASKFAKEALKNDLICSFNNVQEGIKDVLGYDASANTFEELLSTEVILLIGSDIIQDHTIAGLKIKKAVSKGAKLAVINPFDSLSDEWAYKKIIPENNITFLKEIIKSLINDGFTPPENKVSGFEALKKDVEGISVSNDAQEIAQLYGKAKRAMIVFDQKRVSAEAAKLIANIAVISGHIGKARSGIIQLKPQNNSQGLADMGIQKDSKLIVKGIEDGSIKGLMIFGEDIPGIDTSKLSFLMVQDTHLTETAQKADVVLPAASFAESNGTFTSSERRIQKLNMAIPPISKYNNIEIFLKLANLMGARISYNTSEEVLKEIAANIPEYFGADRQIGNGQLFWPVNGSPVLYTNGFNFDDKKARLQIAEEGQFFQKTESTDCFTNAFLQFLKKEELI